MWRLFSNPLTSASTRAALIGTGAHAVASSSATPRSSAAPHRVNGSLVLARRFQHDGSGFGAPPISSSSFGLGAEDGNEDDLHHELASALENEGKLTADAAMSMSLEKVDMHAATRRVRLEKLDRPPARFDLLTNSFVYRWQTTAALARKVTGPMREWATELKYRTGVHMESEPVDPARLQLASEEGGYAEADDVEVNVYLFGSERGIFNCQKLMESILDQEPCYVRLGVFRRTPAGEVEWLLLRRINRELRPPDIPPISLKLPGKWTLLYEQYKEAAMRTLWEETGITVEAPHVFPTAKLVPSDPNFYWRVPVRYFVAEVPYDVTVEGPQVVPNMYMREWDARLLRQSPDPIDRAWAQLANPETGCAWMRRELIDELQLPLRGEKYMAVRYTPPPYANLATVLGFAEVPMAATAPTEAAAGATEPEATETAAADTEASSPPTDAAPAEPVAEDGTAPRE